ncbi:hypothetical protein Pmani_004020 [Petrolisthes manimaculis]|uniref:Uncharacterized protein n=1 Tax=Petrolisthes manimaculis TaxID=1843537 RepID=A0AAE1QEJ4_9EUCA|nr:hypothetical protein Pmani_004020 [Petrolisthes manimaculis]
MLVRIVGLFSQHHYLQILSEELPASWENRAFPFLPGPIYILQNRCPIHTARRVREWLENHDIFRLLDISSNTMDCNGNENMWAKVVNTWEPENVRDGEQLWLHTTAVGNLQKQTRDHSEQCCHF